VQPGFLQHIAPVFKVNTMPSALDSHKFEVYGWKDYKTWVGFNLDVDTGISKYQNDRQIDASNGKGTVHKDIEQLKVNFRCHTFARLTDADTVLTQVMPSTWDQELKLLLTTGCRPHSPFLYAREGR
jgi:hypothetical protein